MDVIKLSDINLLDVGHTIQMAGVIWSGHNSKDHSPIQFVTQLPGKSENFEDLKSMPMTLEEWETFLRQTDLLEIEIIGTDESGKFTKAIYRKSQRAIDNFMQWRVFQRDHYTCRYCGRTGIPLTVDHVILYEEGGPTTEENLVTACKPCNKDRGSMLFEQWLNSDIYKRKSAMLSCEADDANWDLVAKLPELEAKKVLNIRSRK